MKRKLLFLAALLTATVMNLQAANVYFKLTAATSWWANDGAKIGALFKVGTDPLDFGMYAQFFTLVPGTTDTYVGTVPENEDPFVAVQFLRYNSAATDPEEMNYWNATGLETWNGVNDMFTATGSGDTWDSTTGTWSKFGPAEPDMHDFLYFVGLNGNDTVRLNKVGANLTATFEYSKDRKVWTDYTWSVATGAAIALNQGDTVFFRAKGENGKNATMGYTFNACFRFAFGADDSIAAGGNTMSLYDAKCEQDTMTKGGFYNLFSTNPSLVSISELKLPAKKLAEDCYCTMFEKCTSLTTAPELPATTLASDCYNGMFKDCSALTQVPELKATTLAYQCCYQMFQNCTALTVAPALPATKIAERCYASMFDGCTSLTAAPELKADSLANLCYYKMFSGCTSLQVDTCADGSCDGAKLEPTHSGTGEPTSWSKKMFDGCHGDYANNIQLGGHYCIKEYVDTLDYLHFVGLNGNDTVRLDKYATSATGLSDLTATFEYSKDRKNWTEYTWTVESTSATGAAIALNQGDTVFFRAKGVNGKNATLSASTGTYFIFRFGADDSIAAGGNTMSLYDATCKQDTMTKYGFNYLFFKDKQLVSTPKLPATKLAHSCYYSMFTQCSGITKAPELPAITLAVYCYEFMFSSCTALTQAPELKATTLASKCYAYMFKNCTSLQVDTCADGSCNGAELVVPKTGESEWNMNMFDGCHGDAKYTAKYGIQLGGHYCIKEYVDRNDYLHFVGLNGNDTVRLDKFDNTGLSMDKLTATFEYSKDRINWTAYDTWGTYGDPVAKTALGDAIALNQGDTVFFRAKGTNGKNATLSSSSNFVFMFGADDSIAAGGNAMSLYDATCEQDTMTENGFSRLFMDAKQLVSAPKLPATKLAQGCYGNMFNGCTSLTAAPELKATTLAEKCYVGMFQGCTSLTAAPELKATTLADWCYYIMFSNCTSLEVDTCTGSCDGAELVVPTVSGTAPTNWNSKMFEGCKGDAKYTAQYGIKLGGHYCIKEYKEEPDTLDYLHFVGLNGNDTVRLNKFASKDLDKLTATFEYSKDRKTWTPYDTWATSAEPENTYQGNPIALNQGDTVFFRALGAKKDGINATLSYNGTTHYEFGFGADDSIAAGGNAMSLYDATCEQDTMTEKGFFRLFQNATQLVSAPKLPATKLATQCYSLMFQGCTSLITAPELKAEILAERCYHIMFCNCSSLQVDTCADGSCDGVLFEPTTSGDEPSKWNLNMFQGCNGTIITPQLGGHYCIKRYYSCDEKKDPVRPIVGDLTAKPIIIAGLPIDVEASTLEVAAMLATSAADTIKKVDTFWFEVKYEGDAKFKPITNTDTVPLNIGQKKILIRVKFVTECNDTLAGMAVDFKAQFPIQPQIEGMYDQWNIVLNVTQLYADLYKFGVETIVLPDSVKWYQVNGSVDKVDSITGAVVDDQLATPATGFYHTEGKAMEGQYYCVVALPDAKAVVGRTYFQSNVVFVAKPAPTAPIRKAIKDGQLIIIRDDRMYNAQGARL